ncbi:hypothetical protein BDR04DRAFT_987784, partial [Suillus decipiens]
SGTGDGLNFPKQVWNSASGYVNSRPSPANWSKTHSHKSVSSCKNKWGALKSAYQQVIFIKSTSSLTWSDEDGIGLLDKNWSVWNELLKSCPGVKPFTNKGFVHFATIEQMM